MRMQRGRYLLVVAILVAVSWIGYWIGYISARPSPSALAVQGVNHHSPHGPGRLHLAKADQVRVVDDKPEVGDHIRGLHQAHAAHIRNSINKPQEKNTTARNTTAKPKALSLPSKKKVGVEWQHIKEEELAKMERDVPKRVGQKTEKDEKAKPAVQFEHSREHYALVHSGRATKVHGKIHEKLESLPSQVPKEAYIFESKSLPENPRLRPSLANGHLGTVVHGDKVFMNGLYNGYHRESHRAVIPSTCSFNITGTEPETNFTRTYRLNVGEGIYSEVSRGKTYTLTQRVYAHRRLSRLLVVEVDLERTEVSEALKLKVQLNRWTASYDITFLKKDSGIDDVSYKAGKVNAPETDGLTRPEVHVFYDHVPDALQAGAGAKRVKWVFLTAIAASKEEALKAYNEGASLVKSSDALYGQHVAAWAAAWRESRVDVIGNPHLARALYGAWYYILSSMPAAPPADTHEFVGLSPTGLPYGDEDDDYMGHVFWDQETWMYPPVLLFRPDLARMLLFTRHRTQQEAAAHAQLDGYKGLQYPWESGFTGVDVTPDLNCSKYEHHISGDISLSIVQYLHATLDTDLLYAGFLEIVSGIADFWVSRLKYSQQRDLYEIHGVMPPDEDAGVVNNSVYTNEVARQALAAPEYVFSLLHKTETHWKHFADHIYIPFDEAHHYHPEYDSYKMGMVVKQADAVMLGFPLQRDMPPEVRRNDMDMYAKFTNKSGPAMTWPMYTIGWLELGETDKARQTFLNSYNYIKNDFQVWTEVIEGPNHGATNFITGMGGFLQSVLFGYGGLRLLPDRLDVNASLPPDTTELTLTGLAYLGNKLDVTVAEDELTFVVTAQSDGAVGLHLHVYRTEQLFDLALRKQVKVAREKVAIVMENHSQENN